MMDEGPHIATYSSDESTPANLPDSTVITEMDELAAMVARKRRPGAASMPLTCILVPPNYASFFRTPHQHDPRYLYCILPAFGISILTL
ncbi:unnamed protein product [Caenorhabditis auriculariae]|uniref:Uncharacterized protein n=1 Tax=Caenorhabditis auriculariae TaxID=2777116 RepID=A0A8S1GQP0_9PELO|nr:unnamed protein product [Caenorhabditis auriculariae]